MPPETDKPIVSQVDSQEKREEWQQQKEEKTSDIFSLQKESILKNPEFEWLEKETENTINKILTDYQNPNNSEEEKTKNQEILDFLNIDNNLQKVFEEYANNILKTIENPLKKKLNLRKDIWILKDKIQEHCDKNKKEQNQDKEKERNNLFSTAEKDYEKIDSKYKPENNQKDFENFQQTEWPKLKSVFWTEDLLNQYLKHRFVANKIAEDIQKDPEKKVSSENYKFIQSFNAIAKEYGQEEINTEWRKIIYPRETRSISDFTNHPNTSAVLEKNEKVVDYISNTQNNIKLPNEDLVETDIIQKQTLKFHQKDIQKEINEKYNDTYKDLFDKEWNKIKEWWEKLNKEDQENIQTIIDKHTNQIKSDINTSLQKLIASKTIAWCTNEFVRYFNFNKQGNNYWDIELDTDKINIENNTLQTTMNLNGSKTVFNYDLNNGNIKYSDFLHIDNKTVNLGKNTFTNFPINFPSIQDIQNQTYQKIINSDNINKNLNESNSLEDFYQKYSENIGNIDIKNQESPYIKIVIEHTLQKNKVLEKANKFITTFNKSKNSYNDIEDKPIVELYKILDTSLDNYSIDEIKRFDKNLDRLQKEITQTQQLNNPNTDPILNTLFNPEKQEKDQKESYKTGKYTIWPSMTEFFKAISKTEQNNNIPIVDVHLFGKILDKREKNESININNKEISGIQNNEKYINLMERCEKQINNWENWYATLKLDNKEIRPDKPE